MEMEDPTISIDEAVTEIEVPKSPNLFDELRDIARAKNEGTGPRTDVTDPIQIPGWEGHLAARYRRVRLTDLEKRQRVLAKLRLRGGQFNLRVALDTLALACEEIVVWSTKRDEYISIPTDSPSPVRFDDRLTDFIEWPRKDDVYGIIMSIFEQNEMAIIALVMELNKWFANPDHEISESLMGE